MLRIYKAEVTIMTLYEICATAIAIAALIVDIMELLIGIWRRKGKK